MNDYPHQSDTDVIYTTQVAFETHPYVSLTELGRVCNRRFIP